MKAEYFNKMSASQKACWIVNGWYAVWGSTALWREAGGRHHIIDLKERVSERAGAPYGEPGRESTSANSLWAILSRVQPRTLPDASSLPTLTVGGGPRRHTSGSAGTAFIRGSEMGLWLSISTSRPGTTLSMQR